MSNSVDSKKEYREHISRQKKELENTLWQHYNDLIQHKLLQETLWVKAKHVALYYSVDKEVDTITLIEKAWQDGKEIYLPKCGPRDRSLTFYRVDSFDQLETVYYGIPEPDPQSCVEGDPAIFDLMIVPGLAFDSEGYRIGYGAGYYDRFLSRSRLSSPLISLAFPFQVTERKLPTDDYDIPVDIIYLPEDTILCRENREKSGGSNEG